MAVARTSRLTGKYYLTTEPTISQVEILKCGKGGGKRWITRQKELVANVHTFIWWYVAISTNTLTPMIMPAVTFTMNPPMITNMSLDPLSPRTLALPAKTGGAGGWLTASPTIINLPRLSHQRRPQAARPFKTAGGAERTHPSGRPRQGRP